MSEAVRWYAGTITERDAARLRQMAGSYQNDRLTKGDARRCGLATPRQEGQHASDVVAEFVHEVWSGPKSGKRSLAYYLAIEETGISQIDIAISYLLFTSPAKFERLCQVLTDTKPPVRHRD